MRLRHQMTLAAALLFSSSGTYAVTPLSDIIDSLSTTYNKIDTYSATASVLQCAG